MVHHLRTYNNNNDIMIPTIVHYPIPGNACGGLLHIYGKRNAKDIILYCGGWPDGVEPFTPLAKRLATPQRARDNHSEEDNGCFVGITCWPGFDKESFSRLSNFCSFKREGYNFDEVTCCIREAANQLFLEYNSKSRPEDMENHTINENKRKDGSKFTVIFHDFGVLTGLMFVNRSIEEKYFTEHRPDRVVLLDVINGPHQKFKTQFRHMPPYKNHEILVHVAYRGTYACAFAAARYLSSTIGIMVFGILWNFIKLSRLIPLRGIDMRMIAERKMDLHHMVYTMYPYYNLFQCLVYNTHALAKSSLPLDLVQTPVLYLYGPEKNVVSFLFFHQIVFYLYR